MICTHCNEQVVRNTVKHSAEPWTYHPYKHAVTFLIGCFNGSGNPLGRKAEPKESR